MAVFCFCSNYNSTLTRKTRVSVSNLSILSIMDRSRVFKSTIRWSSCSQFCLRLITKGIQITFLVQHGARRKSDCAQIYSDYFCPKSRDFWVMFFSLSLASQNPTSSRISLSNDLKCPAWSCYASAQNPGRYLYKKNRLLLSHGSKSRGEVSMELDWVPKYAAL